MRLANKGGGVGVERKAAFEPFAQHLRLAATMAGARGGVSGRQGCRACFCHGRQKHAFAGKPPPAIFPALSRRI